ncbi:MAG: hypothetical protein ABIE94_02425 [archaeon]
MAESDKKPYEWGRHEFLGRAKDLGLDFLFRRVDKDRLRSHLKKTGLELRVDMEQGGEKADIAEIQEMTGLEPEVIAVYGMAYGIGRFRELVGSLDPDAIQDTSYFRDHRFVPGLKGGWAVVPTSFVTPRGVLGIDLAADVTPIPIKGGVYGLEKGHGIPIERVPIEALPAGLYEQTCGATTPELSEEILDYLTHVVGMSEAELEAATQPISTCQRDGYKKDDPWVSSHGDEHRATRYFDRLEEQARELPEDD